MQKTERSNKKTIILHLGFSRVKDLSFDGKIAEQDVAHKFGEDKESTLVITPNEECVKEASSAQSLYSKQRAC